MKLKTTDRKLSAKELRLLKLVLRNRIQELQSKNHLRFFLISLSIGITFACIAWMLKDGFFLFLTGTIAVFAFIAFIFSIAPTFKEKLVEKKTVNDLAAYIEKGVVTVSNINSLNIAEVSDHENESNLFIIEFEKDKILYYWDFKYSLYDKFPCEQFEIYDATFYKFANREINFLSPKIEVTTISLNKNSSYFNKFRKPAHMEIINKNFKELISEIKNYA
ncbi:hypothetical protein D3C87_154680 [compost metagenome]